MKNLLLYILFIIVSIGINIGYAQEDTSEEFKVKNLDVTLGIDKILKLDFTPSTKIQVGTESILTYQLIPQKREITLKGLRAGKTSVTIRNTIGDIKSKYLVTVTADEKSRVVKDLKEFLGHIDGLKIVIKGGKVVLEGNITVPDDIGIISVIHEKYPDVINLVELSPQTARVISRKMQNEIHRNGMKDVTVRLVNKIYWLEGVVSSQGKKGLAETLATGYLSDRLSRLSRGSRRVERVGNRSPIKNFITVNAKKAPQPVPKLIKIIAQFVELAKDYGKIFGFSWTPMLAGGGGSIKIDRGSGGDVNSSSKNTLTGTISNLFPKLASAKSAGHARIIQSAMIIIKDKVKGTIKKDTQVPFAMGTGEFQRSETATTGLDLNITPTILEGEKIDLAIGLSVKISAGSAPGGGPVTTNNSISSSLIVKSKESAAIGGIVFNTKQTDFDRDPPGGAIEVKDPTVSAPLFSFIRSKKFSNSKSQFVVFVTPEIIASATQGTEEIKRKFRQRGR